MRDGGGVWVNEDDYWMMVLKKAGGGSGTDLCPAVPSHHSLCQLWTLHNEYSTEHSPNYYITSPHTASTPQSIHSFISICLFHFQVRDPLDLNNSFRRMLRAVKVSRLVSCNDDLNMIWYHLIWLSVNPDIEYIKCTVCRVYGRIIAALFSHLRRSSSYSSHSHQIRWPSFLSTNFTNLIYFVADNLFCLSICAPLNWTKAWGNSFCRICSGSVPMRYVRVCVCACSSSLSISPLQ